MLAKIRDDRVVTEVDMNYLETLAKEDTWSFEQIYHAARRFRRDGNDRAANRVQELLHRVGPNPVAQQELDRIVDGMDRILDLMERGRNQGTVPAEGGGEVMPGAVGTPSTTRRRHVGQHNNQRDTHGRSPGEPQSNRGGSGASEATSSNRSRRTARVAGASSANTSRSPGMELTQLGPGRHRAPSGQTGSLPRPAFHHYLTSIAPPDPGPTPDSLIPAPIRISDIALGGPPEQGYGSSQGTGSSRGAALSGRGSQQGSGISHHEPAGRPANLNSPHSTSVQGGAGLRVPATGQPPGSSRNPRPHRTPSALGQGQPARNRADTTTRPSRSLEPNRSSDSLRSSSTQSPARRLPIATQASQTDDEAQEQHERAMQRVTSRTGLLALGQGRML